MQGGGDFQWKVQFQCVFHTLTDLWSGGQGWSFEHVLHFTHLEQRICSLVRRQKPSRGDGRSDFTFENIVTKPTEKKLLIQSEEEKDAYQMISVSLSTQSSQIPRDVIPPPRAVMATTNHVPWMRVFLPYRINITPLPCSAAHAPRARSKLPIPRNLPKCHILLITGHVL